jgi:hypothetical protein
MEGRGLRVERSQVGSLRSLEATTFDLPTFDLLTLDLAATGSAKHPHAIRPIDQSDVAKVSLQRI